MARPSSWTALDTGVAAALAASHLRDVPPDRVQAVLAGATLMHVAAGSTLRREGDPDRHLELVIAGVLRNYLAGPDGRTLTVRYCRAGSLIGAVSLCSPGYATPGSIQALVDATLLSLRPEVVLALAETDPVITQVLLRELGDRVMAFVAQIYDRAFASVRQRVARHLLDLASHHQQGPALVAPVSQQDLADAAGTVREVVVRILRQLRNEGTVATQRHGIVILAPDRLLAELLVPAGRGT